MAELGSKPQSKKSGQRSIHHSNYDILDDFNDVPAKLNSSALGPSSHVGTTSKKQKSTAKEDRLKTTDLVINSANPYIVPKKERDPAADSNVKLRKSLGALGTGGATKDTKRAPHKAKSGKKP